MDRRDFLKLHYGLAVMGAVNESKSAIAREQRIFSVPENVQEPNIKEIGTTLESRLPVGQGEYTRQFINLVQHAHKSLTGQNYRQHRRQVDPSDNNPLEVVIQRDLKGRIDMKYGFFHGSRPGEANRVYIDSASTPTEFLVGLNTALVYGVYGPGRVNALAHTHRDIAYIVSKNPQLLKKDDLVCPLTYLMYLYVNEMLNDVIDGPHEVSGALPYIAILSVKSARIDNDTYSDIDITKAVEMGVKHGLRLDTILDSMSINLFGAHKHPRGKNLLKSMIGSFLSKTERYVLQENGNFPKEALDLLRKKKKQIRERVDSFLTEKT